MRIFKTKPFSRWASDQLTKAILKTAVQEMNDGLVDANLGGHVYKKRAAIPGRGKSGGVRTLIAFRSGDRAVFMYGFAKGQKANISKKELQALKKLAKEYLAYNDGDLKRTVRAGELIEVK